MASRVRDQATAAAIDGLTASLDALRDTDLDPADVADAIELTRELEVVSRQLRAVQLAVAGAVDRRGLHRLDGHASIKVYLRHNARLSDAEAGRRAAAVRCLRHLPAVREAFASGRIGTCHLHRIAAAYANRRVREELCSVDANLALLAERLGYVAFDREISDWVRLHDQDGTRDANERDHHNRDASLLQDPDLSWRLRGHWGALVGARLREILDAAIAAETVLDWEQARAEHGPDATAAHLPRTDNQRRADALEHLLDLGAAGFAAETGCRVADTNLIIDQATFEHELARLAGHDPGPVPPRHPLDVDPGGGGGGDGHPPPLPAPGYRCQTTTGHRLEPTEAVAAALLGHLRRVVLGADGVTIDVGRRSRLFTGPAHLAATIAHHHCYWPGCHVPVAACQADHLRPWSRGGRTDPGNGAPACGRHNRLKEHGYTIRRDERGRLHTHRPDGTEIA